MKTNLPEISRITGFECGDSVQIFGENFENKMKIYYWQDSTKSVSPENSYNVSPELPPKEAKIIFTNEVLKQVAYIESDKVLKNGPAIFWVENSNGISKPFLANRIEIWNQSAKTVHSGGNITVFGRGFGEVNNGYLEDINSKEIFLLDRGRSFINYYLYDAYKYSMEYVVPKNIPEGKYNLYVHVENGGILGWSNPINVSVCNTCSITEYCRERWNRLASDIYEMPKTTVKTVQPVPDGALVDSYPLIQNAIDSVSEEGGIVLLSSGTYGISKTLVIKPGVVLMGAGSGATTIRVADGITFSMSWEDVVFASRKNNATTWASDWGKYIKANENRALARIYTNAGIEGVRFELGGGANIGILLANNEDKEIYGAFLNHVTVDGGYLTEYWRNDEFGFISSALLSVGNNNRMTVWSSSFSALSPIQILPARNCDLKIINNIFKCTPRQCSESYFGGIYDSMIVGNDFIGGRRSLVSQAGFENNWVYQNRSYGVSRSSNAEEVYMCEYGRGEWCGKALKVYSNSIEIEKNTADIDPGASFNDRLKEYDRYLCIIDGRGLGQYRKVISSEKHLFIIDEPWDVMPDETTVFTLTPSNHHNLWIDNNSENSNGHSQFIYGCGIENVISGHEIIMAQGIEMFAGYTQTNGNNPEKIALVAFNTIEHCQMRASGNGIVLFSGPYFSEKDKLNYFRRTRGVFGNVIVRNVMDGSVGNIYEKNQKKWRDEMFDSGIAIGGGYNQISENHILGYENDIQLLYDCEGNYCSKNISNSGKISFAGVGIPAGTDKQ